MNIPDIYFDWTILVSWFDVFRFVCFFIGLGVLIDMVCLAYFMDPKKTSTSAKIFASLMQAPAMLLMFGAWYGLRDDIFVGLVIGMLMFLLARLILWAKGLYLSEFLAGKNVHLL